MNRNVKLEEIIYSIGVELVQYITKAGIMDIDDVILNTMGGLIGVVIYKGIEFAFKEKNLYAIELMAPIGGVVVLLVLYYIYSTDRKSKKRILIEINKNRRMIFYGK